MGSLLEALRKRALQAQASVKRAVNDNEGFIRKGKPTLAPIASVQNNRVQFTPKASQTIRNVSNTAQNVSRRIESVPVVGGGIYKPVEDAITSTFKFASDPRAIANKRGVGDYASTVGKGVNAYLSLKGGKKLLSGSPLQAAIGIGTPAAFGGAFNKVMGGDFKEGAISGLNVAPRLAGIGGLTNPIIQKASLTVGSKFANPLSRAIANRVATGVGNIPEGMIMGQAMGRTNYNPQDAALDFSIGALTGSRLNPNIKGKAKGTVGRPGGLQGDDMDLIQKANEVWRNKKKYNPKQLQDAKNILYNSAEKFLGPNERPESGNPTEIANRIFKKYKDVNSFDSGISLGITDQKAQNPANYTPLEQKPKVSPESEELIKTYPRKLGSEEIGMLKSLGATDTGIQKLQQKIETAYREQEGITTKVDGKTVFTPEGKQKMGNLMYDTNRTIRNNPPQNTVQTNPQGLKVTPSVQTAPQGVSSKPVRNYTPLKRSTQESQSEQVRLKDPINRENAKSLPDTIVNNRDLEVKQKVGLLDYIRTPDRVLNKIGLADEAKLIRKKYDDYLLDLPKEINKVTEWSKKVDKDGNRKIFNFLDGQKVQLNEQEQKVADEVRSYLKDWAKKLGLPEDKQISHYITHIFEEDFIKKEFDPDIANLIKDRVPGSVYDPFLEQRLGQMGYIEDTWRALDAYVKRATRKFHMDPALAKVKFKSEGLEQSQFDYVKNYVERINLRPTKVDNLIDNTIKQMVGYKFGQRPVARLSRKARQAIYRGTLGLNVGSALKNLSQGANTYAKLGERWTLHGYVSLLKNIKNPELERVGVLKQDMIQDRVMSASRQTMQKVDEGLFKFFETAERISRGAAYFGAKAKYLHDHKNATEEEAIEYAKNIVRDTQFTFGSVDTPVAMQSDIAKLLTQFQSYTLKQGEFLGEMVKAKDIAGLARYSIASIAVVHTIGQLYGMELKDIIPSVRIGLPPTISAPVEAGKAVLGVPDKFGNVPSPEQRVKNFGKSLIPLVPGGVQIKKTYEGLKDTSQGYSESQSGRVQYTVPQDAGSRIKGGLFGKQSFGERGEYFDEGRGVLGEEQSEQLKQSENKEEFYSQLVKERQERSQEDTIYDSLKEGTAFDPENVPAKTSANAIYRRLEALPKEEREAEYQKLSPYVTDEIRQEMVAIGKLKAEGLTSREDRDLITVPEELRARRIYERLKSLDEDNRKAKYETYVKLGIVNQTIHEQMIKIGQER